MLMLEKLYACCRQSEIDIHHDVVGDYAKRGIILTLLLILICSFTFSQGRNNFWGLGYASFSGDTSFGGLAMTFPNNVRNIYDNPRDMWFEFSNSSICDTGGNLLFYTNGVYIANAIEDTMLNGSGLNPSFYTSAWTKYGLSIPQCNIILPKPGSDSLYLLFHETITLSAPNCYCPDEFYYSEINMQGDSGRGEVIKKNVVIFEDSLVGGAITACKHANGRDWWVVAPEKSSEMGAYIMLATPDTVQVYNYQKMHAIGLSSAQANFSPDGSKYVITNTRGISFYDFDRCNGVFTFLDSVDFGDSTFNWGASVSPNSRYCYLSHTWKMYQYDLQATDISASQILVAEWDSMGDPNPFWTTIFWLHQLGPDVKIYVSTGCTMGMHTINMPDVADTLCNVEQRAIHFQHFNCAIPNFPNYDLGRLTGSPCDTLQWVGTPETPNPLQGGFRSLRINPNPANNSFYIKYDILTNENLLFVLYDSYGKEVLRKNLYGTFKNLLVHSNKLANGIYFWRAVQDYNTKTQPSIGKPLVGVGVYSASGKIVILH